MGETDEPKALEQIDEKPSIFWRIPNDEPRRKGDREAVSMIEIDADGWIPREISLAADGTPLDITRPGEYGVWNDSPIPLSPPGSPQFAETWGAWGSEMSREEFEDAYERADRLLPEKHPAGWLPFVAGCILVLAFVGGASAGLFSALGEIIRAIFG
jgi:hypothetical protein